MNVATAFQPVTFGIALSRWDGIMVGLGNPDHRIKTMKREDYLKEWKKLTPLVIKMTKKDGLCNHVLGDTFVLKNPYDKPNKICSALWHVIEFYSWRAALGFPSWEPDNENVYRLHCPCETGTVWEMRKATAAEQQEHLSSGENP